MFFKKIINYFLDKFKLDSKSISRIIGVWKTYLIPNIKLIVFSIIYMMLAAIFEALTIRLLQPIFDEVFISKNIKTLYFIGIEVVLISAAKGLSAYMQEIKLSRVGLDMVKNMQISLFAHLMKLDISFFNQKSSGDLLNHFIGDVNIIKDAMLNGVTSLVRDTCTVIFMIFLMFYKNLEMALVTFVLFPMAFYPLIYFGKKVRFMTAKQQMNSGGLYGTLAQSFRGIKIIKSYCVENKEIEKIAYNANIISNISYDMNKINSVLSPLMEFFGGIAVAATLSYGGFRIMQGKLSVGGFMVFLFAIVAAYKPLKNLAGLNVRVQMGIAALDRIFALFDAKPIIIDNENAIDLKIKEGKIEVKNLSFSYIKGQEVLHKINFVAEPNKTTAIVGASGSGKSTLISLFLRFYDSNEGNIFIDGKDIKDIKISSLRKQIAFVSQDVVLFDDTIKNNIVFGKENVKDDEIIDVSKKAAAHNFIMNKEHQYEEKVGESGKNLSGGQKQMISVARAMLKDAPILLLDEATSSLDSKSEYIVQESLEKLMEGRTTIVIAHRLSTIVNADKIYVFDNGNIVEEGTHNDLLKQNSYYAKLYNLQFKK